MEERTKPCRASMLALHRKQASSKMRTSRRVDAPCFAYLFRLKEIAAFKVGISIDPLTRICNLPQLHMRVQDIFDLERSVAVHALHRQDARKLERAMLRHHAQWQVEAPCSAVVYVNGSPRCAGPIRWFAGGRNEWLDAQAYESALDFLLYADRRWPRPSISIQEWVKQLQKGQFQ